MCFGIDRFLLLGTTVCISLNGVCVRKKIKNKLNFNIYKYKFCSLNNEHKKETKILKHVASQ